MRVSPALGLCTQEVYFTNARQSRVRERIQVLIVFQAQGGHMSERNSAHFQDQLVLSAQGTIGDEIWLFQLAILLLICE